MILPLTHERSTVSKLPWVSFTIIGLCFVAFLATRSALEDSSSDELGNAIEYYLAHPYLKLDTRLVPPESHAVLEQAVAEAGGKKDAFGNATAAVEQQELDRLTRAWLDKVGNSPIWRYGLIPTRRTPTSLVTHMFLHGGWLHLLGNLFFFYLLGPFVEDVWGRKWFAAFYLTAGVFSGLMFTVNYPHLYRPLIGASGAIAGVMGAFVILHGRTKIRFLYWLGIFFGTFRAPAWLMLPLWFLGELASARSIDRAAPGGVLGGTAYWAHVWGFLFGIAVALVLRRFKVGEIDDSVAPPSLGESALDEAREAEDRGEPLEAWRLLSDALRQERGNLALGGALWELAVRMKRGAEVAPFGQRLIRSEIQSGAFESALTHWRELRAAAPRAVDVAASIRLAEEALRRDWKEDARDVIRGAVEVLGDETPVGSVMKLVRLAEATDKDLHQDVVERALRRSDLTPELRQQLDEQFWRL